MENIENIDNQYRNDIQLEKQFSRLGVGLFIHWSIDSVFSLGLSHWIPGASREAIDKYISQAPKLFFADEFCADKWAHLAKRCGLRYAVFTTKHHNGFCMFQTTTTPFGSKHRNDLSLLLPVPCVLMSIVVGHIRWLFV